MRCSSGHAVVSVVAKCRQKLSAEIFISKTATLVISMTYVAKFRVRLRTGYDPASIASRKL